MTTSDTRDDGLSTGLALVGGGVAGYAVGRFVLARVLDDRERATAATTATSAAPTVTAAISAPPLALIDPYPSTPAPAAPPTEPAPKPKPKPSAPAPTTTHEITHTDGPVTSPSQVDPGPVSHPSQVDPQVPAAAPASLIDPYPTSAAPITPPSTAPGRVPHDAPLSRDYDRIFNTYRGAIAIEYLRALATRESGMTPGERKGPAWGLMQIIEAVRLDYNRAHKTSYTREHLLDPTVNVAIACWLLRTIIASFHKNHPDVPNLRADWDNPEFVRLLTFSWNAGHSEKAGVGRMAHFLKERGLPVTIDNVHQHAKEAKASRHLQNAKKVKWCKGVAALYLRERKVQRPRGAADSAAELIRFRGMKDWDELWTALKAFFVDRRGYDVAANKMHVPRTTHDDIRQLVALWDRCAASARLDVFGVKGAVAEWRALSAEAKQVIATGAPETFYPDNARFWRVTRRLAIRVEIGAEEPPDVDFWDALAKNVKAAPGRVVDAIQAVAGAGGDAAEAVGGGIKDAVTGAADAAGDAVKAITKPILIGAGIVGAAVLGVVLLKD